MPRPEVLLLVLACLVVMTACSRLTFVRPDPSPRGFKQVAPEYSFRSDPSASSLVRQHLLLAERRLQDGEFDEAEKQTRLALKQSRRSADAHTMLALIESARGRTAQAGGYYARAAELAPEQGIALNNYGAWLCDNGRQAESVGWFDRALADPAYNRRASAMANAGACLLSAGQLDQVDRYLRPALDLAPDNVVALGAMAELQYRSGHFLEARAFSQRRLEAATATPAALLLASQIEDKLGDTRAATRYVQQLNADFPQAGAADTGEIRKP
ncbi:type IV pilus biogenesis/stability protein PilW [Luteimonas sp. RIT-PG2_3]